MCSLTLNFRVLSQEEKEEREGVGKKEEEKEKEQKIIIWKKWTQIASEKDENCMISYRESKKPELIAQRFNLWLSEKGELGEDDQKVQFSYIYP